MSKKKELGKGIRALLSNIDTDDKKSSSAKRTDNKSTAIQEIPIKDIEVNPFQPRKDFDEDELASLANSILEIGLIQPITVRKLGDKYQLISGERRYRAAQIAKLSKLPAYIRTANDQEMTEMALIENIQRSDLNALEIAFSYQRLISEFKLTQDALSKRVAKKRSTISNYIRLLKLPPTIQKSIKSGQISMGHARVLAGMSDPSKQLVLFNKIITQSLSVRQTESALRPVKSGSNRSNSQSKNPFIRDVENKLSASVGSKVQIQQDNKGKGKITITFTDTEHLNEILDRFDD